MGLGCAYVAERSLDAAREASCRGKAAGRKHVGGCCCHPERDKGAWREGRGCGEGRKAGFGTQLGAPFSEFSRTHGTGNWALTTLSSNLTLIASLRSEYRHVHFADKQTEAGSGGGRVARATPCLRSRARVPPAQPSPLRSPRLPRDGPLPRFLSTLGPGTGPGRPSPPGPIFPKGLLSFLETP